MTKMQRLSLVLVMLFLCTGCDQLTKDIAKKTLISSPTISLLNDTIRIQYVENHGAFLGIGSNLPDEVRFVIFALFAGLVLLMTLVYTIKSDELKLMQAAGLSILAAGGMGNLIDRIFNQGVAIDFLNIGIGRFRTGIFNVADLFILAGAALFIFSLKGIDDRFLHPAYSQAHTENDRGGTGTQHQR